MEQKSSTEYREQLLSSTNANEALKESYSIIEKLPIDNTPFVLTKDEQNRWFITLGLIILSNAFESQEEAMQWYNENTMHIIANMIAGMIALNHKFNNKI